MKEGRLHVGSKGAASVHGFGGGFLGDAAGAAGELALQLGAGCCNPLGCCDVSDAPSRHGESLGDAIDGHGALHHAGLRGKAGVLLGEVDVLVNLIGDDHGVGVALETAASAAISSAV